MSGETLVVVAAAAVVKVVSVVVVVVVAEEGRIIKWDKEGGRVHRHQEEHA